MTFEEQKRIISEALDKAYTPLEWFEQIIEIAYEKGINIQKLPPVKPQLKTGHWIDNHNNTISCDHCQTWFNKDDRYGYMHYCPYCNTKMIEPQKRSE